MQVNLDHESVRARNADAMRALLDYRAPEPHLLTKILWRCAGADSQLLRYCTHAEHVTYAGLGAFVLITGLLATLTGGYALYTVFKPTDGSPDTIAILISVAFGLFWGTMIFNLDRYIVATSGKGDGKESISLQELKNAAPRILLAVVIGMVMSAPLELRLFKREIDVALEQRRIDARAQLEQRDSALFAARATEIDSTIRAYADEIAEARRTTDVAYDQMREEADGTAGSRIAGAGPRFEAKRQRYEMLKAGSDVLIQDRLRRQDSLRGVRGGLERSLEAEQERKRKVVEEMGGIVDQMQIAHEKGGLMVWVIRLLIILLEVMPVLSKLMYRTGPYDILQEHLRIILPARLGVSTETRDLLVDGELITRTTELFPMAAVVHSAANDQLAAARAQENAGSAETPLMATAPAGSLG